MWEWVFESTVCGVPFRATLLTSVFTDDALSVLSPGIHGGYVLPVCGCGCVFPGLRLCSHLCCPCWCLCGSTLNRRPCTPRASLADRRYSGSLSCLFSLVCPVCLSVCSACLVVSVICLSVLSWLAGWRHLLYGSVQGQRNLYYFTRPNLGFSKTRNTQTTQRYNNIQCMNQ